MKRRLLALVLPLALCLLLPPAAALAGEVMPLTIKANPATGYTYTGGTLTITHNGDYEIGMAQGVVKTTNHIEVSGGVTANITLTGVHIDVSANDFAAAFKIADDSTGNVTITLADGSDNYLKSGNKCAGLQKNGIGKLTIKGGNAGTGKLTAESGEDDHREGAGIGGGRYGSSSNITISGGTVTATSYYGAGIGGGSSGSGSYITISDGNVKATSNEGAGIGGGFQATGSYITISGGDVKATSKDGASIGGGRLGTCSNITISGGTVTATSGSGAGIGSGGNAPGSNITISGGTVTATSEDGAGIGGGFQATGSSIFLSGGSVKASGTYAIGGGEGAITPTNRENGDQVYLTTITVKNDASTTVPADTPLDSLTVSERYPYGMKDVKTDESGKIYVYLPSGKAATVTRTAAAPPAYYTGSVISNESNTAAGDFLPATAPGGVSLTPGVATVNERYSGTLAAATGNPASMTWTANGLPAWLTLDSSAGIVSGTPTAYGLFTFTVTADNGCGSAAKEVTIHVHSWAAAWTTTNTHHWHACEGASCPITADSEKDGYGAHVYDPDTDVICSICGYNRTPLASDNTITGISPGQPFVLGETVTFTATGGGMSNSAPAVGDMRYLPTLWRANPSGDFASGYTQRFSTAGMTLGNHTLTVTFTMQRYNGAAWENLPSAVTDAKSVSFSLAAEPAPVAPPTIDPPSTALDRTIAVPVGGTATLSITSTGAASHQWYQSIDGGASFFPIDRATGSSYTTSPVALANDGYRYYCIATNSLGSAQSCAFVLKVSKQPVIPATGDSAMPGLWLAAMLLAGAGLAASVVRRRRRRNG